MSSERDSKRAALELAASAAQTMASLSPALGVPYLTPALQGVAAILRASEVAMRMHGKTVDDIVRDISLPKAVDETFRREVDEEISRKPRRGG